MKHSVVFALLFALFSCTLSAQTVMGYTTADFVRDQGVGFSSEESTQGVAIYISAEKAALLKGAQITGLRFANATRKIDSGEIFVTKELGGTSLSEEEVTGFGTSLRDFTFSSPVTIDGEAFYVGYTVVLSSTASVNPCLFDETEDFAEGTVWGYDDGEWIDVSAKGYGGPILQMLVEEAPDFTDLVLKPVSTSGFFKIGESYTMSAQVFNFGTETVTSLTLHAQVGSGAEQTYSFSDLSIEPNTVYDLSLENLQPEETGSLTLSMEVDDVNAGVDADEVDNSYDSSLYVYPESVERKLLLENYTGQSCTSCPAGHKVIESAVEEYGDELVVVAHHTYTSYYGDAFTMEEDMDYGAWFFGSSSYAPGVSVDRAPYEDGLSSVIFGYSITIANGLAIAIPLRESTEPYVSVGMTNEFDEETGKGTVTCTIHTYKSPSDEVHALNVWLVQDSLIAYQASGSSTYEHNHVFRGSLNGTWGTELALTPGGTEVQSFEYEIGDSITSSYLNEVSWATVPEKMYLVAFVSDATSDNLTCIVHNTNTLPLLTNGSTTSIDAYKLTEGTTVRAVVDGRNLRISGAFTKADVYGLDGRRVASLGSTGSSVPLSPGAYVVRVDGRSQKIIVR